MATLGFAFGCSSSVERILLRPGAVYPRVLAGEPHSFRFAAGAGTLLHLIVHQRGVDVVVLLRDPTGRLVYESDSPTGKTGDETVLAVTAVAGEYLLAVEPFARGAKGRYAVEIREARPARPDDRARAAAAAPLARAERRRLQGDFARAAVAYREALPRLEASKEREKLAGANWYLGKSLVETGELRSAAAALEQAVADFRGLGDAIGEARALNDLGAVRKSLGETGGAVAAHQRALQLYGDAGNLVGRATTLNDLGLVLETTGDLQGAISRYEEALSLWRGLGLRSPEAATLQNLGSLYALIGYDQEALDLLHQAMALLAGESNPGKRVSILIAVGWAEYLAGQPEQALDRYGEALQIAERAKDRLGEAGILDRRGSALRALHRYGEAADSYLRSLEASRAAGSRLGEGHTLANLGWLDLEMGAVVRGRLHLRQALELLAKSGALNGEVYARVGLSRAERMMGAFGPAREQAEAAIHLVEDMHTALRGAASRGQFLATRFNAYEELVSVLMDLARREPARDYARQALEVAERARARNLMDEVAGGRASGAGGAEKQRQSLLADIHALEDRRQVLAAQDSGSDLERLDAALRARWLELDGLSSISSSQPVLEAASAAEIQALADERSLLIVYMLAEPASFAWTVDRNGVVAHVLPGRQRIEKLARQVLAALSEGQALAAQGTAAAAAHELSLAILAPLASRLVGRQCLVILADGALHLVPFAALPTPSSGAESAAEPLVVRHEIAMIPSATFLRWQRRHLAGRRLAPGLLAVLADPVFSADDARLATVQRARSTSQATERQPAAAPYPAPLDRLLYTTDEARVITAFAPRDKVLLALGTAASRDLVLSGALGRYQTLHFATHGLLDPVLPERSGIELSRFDAKGMRRDGFLSAPNIAALDLPAELAVLSGCETGLGREVRGEGLVGLTQAFFRAGTRRVVVSSWKVQDRATAELMGLFYRKLLVEKLAPAAALRAAQLALRSEEAWRSPYFWAGFSLQGDWR